MDTTPEKPRIRVYRCPKCQIGLVMPVAVDGRFYQYKDAIINLPAHVFVPRCNHCRTNFLTKEIEAVVQQVLDAEYNRHAVMIAACITRLRQRKGIN